MRMAEVLQISQNSIAIGEEVLVSSVNVTGLNETSVAEWRYFELISHTSS